MILDLARDDFVVAIAFVCSMAFVCGWLADRIMGYSGFGVIGNWLLLFSGALAGLYFIDSYGYRLAYEPMVTVTGGFSGAAAALLSLATFKAVTHT
jgi:uncharacterized membrane protein YeaQ/YmgE (transglycosylase-associated protein family)